MRRGTTKTESERKRQKKHAVSVFETAALEAERPTVTKWGKLFFVNRTKTPELTALCVYPRTRGDALRLTTGFSALPKELMSVRRKLVTLGEPLAQHAPFTRGITQLDLTFLCEEAEEIAEWWWARFLPAVELGPPHDSRPFPPLPLSERFMHQWPGYAWTQEARDAYDVLEGIDTPEQSQMVAGP